MSERPRFLAGCNLPSLFGLEGLPQHVTSLRIDVPSAEALVTVTCTFELSPEQFDRVEAFNRNLQQEYVLVRKSDLSPHAYGSQPKPESPT